MKTSCFAHVQLGCFLAASLAAGLLGAPPAAAQQQTLGERPSLPTAVDLQKPPKPTLDDDADAPPPPAPRQRRRGPEVPQQAPTTQSQFNARASMTQSLVIDDNIYARSSSKVGDRIVVVRPELGLDYRSPQFLASVNAAFENRNYLSHPQEDNHNWLGNIATTWLPQSDIQVQTRLAAQDGHEQRGTADAQFFAFDNPTEYHQYDAALAFNKRFDGWWTSVGGARTWIDYDTPTIGGVPIDQSYRNGNISVLTGRIGKVVMPLTSAFLEVSGNKRDFKLDSFDSQGFRVVGGALFEPGPGARIRGEVFAGYMQQNYTTFINFSTFTYGGSLAFRLDPRFVAFLDGRREAKESALNGGVSVLESAVNARVDYQVTERFTVGAGLGYLNQLYKTVPDRVDTSWGPIVSAKYFLTPNVTFGADYRYIGFSSDTFGVGSYARNVFLLSVSGRL